MIEVLVDDLTAEGMRRLTLVSDRPIDAATTLPMVPPAHAEVSTRSDNVLGLHYLEATWACREAVGIRCEGWTRRKVFVLWKLAPDERVSAALKSALGVYAETFKGFPAYAFLRKLPSTIENGFEAEDMMLFEAEWVPPGCVVIGTGE